MNVVSQVKPSSVNVSHISSEVLQGRTPHRRDLPYTTPHRGDTRGRVRVVCLGSIPQALSAGRTRGAGMVGAQDSHSPAKEAVLPRTQETAALPRRSTGWARVLVDS